LAKLNKKATVPTAAVNKAIKEADQDASAAVKDVKIASKANVQFVKNHLAIMKQREEDAQI